MKADMSPTAESIPGPVLPLHIELAPAFHRTLGEADATGAAAALTGRGVAELLRTLGIPGTPSVTIDLPKPNSGPRSRCG